MEIKKLIMFALLALVFQLALKKNIHVKAMKKMVRYVVIGHN